MDPILSPTSSVNLVPGLQVHSHDDSYSDDEVIHLVDDSDLEIPYWATEELLAKPIAEWIYEDFKEITFQSEDDAQQFYNTYASVAGFSIRKDRLIMMGQMVGSRTFVCSRAGFRVQKHDKYDGSSTSKQRLVTRCGCTASFRVKYSMKHCAYQVVHFNPHHNHDLAPSNYTQFLRSQRKVDDCSANQVAELGEVGITPSKIMDVLVNSRGGFEWVGFTRKDLYNHVYRTKIFTVRSNDTHLAMNYIQAIAAKDPRLYCRYHVDDDNRLTRIFYSDTISRAEYRAFGDVVVFETFLGCMEGKQPRSIITDGDQAMRSAIAQVMPKTRHRLCGWHLLRNSSGVCADPNFKRSLSRLMTKKYPIPVFTYKWTSLLDKYGLNKGDRRWVAEMQQSCHLWAESYFTNCYFAGMATNERAESTNKTLKGFVNRHLPLSQFFHKYQLFLDTLRQKAMGLECVNMQSMPHVPEGSFHSIRSQMAQLYTIEVYAKVDEQIRKEQMFRTENLPGIVGSTESRFVVQRYGVPDKEVQNVYFVKCDRNTKLLSCCCGMVESVGIPCTHIFAVMKQEDIRQLNEGNLTPRWMKTARSLCNLSSSYARHVEGPDQRLITIRPYCETLAYLASRGDDNMDIAKHEIQKLCHHLSTTANSDQLLEYPSENTNGGVRPSHLLKDLSVVRTKGVPKHAHNPAERKCGICKKPGHRRQTCPNCPKGVRQSQEESQQP